MSHQFTTTTHYVGRTPSRDRLYLTVELSHRDGLPVLSLRGTLVRYRTHTAVSVGQIKEELSGITMAPEWGTSITADDLLWLWNRWHLNHMRAHCPHMDLNSVGDSPDGRRHLRCPAEPSCGTYGSMWWHEPLPPEVLYLVERIQRLPIADISHIS